MDGLVAHFRAVADPRARDARHDFLEVIFAVLCGAEDCIEMALSARAKLDVLRPFAADDKKMIDLKGSGRS